MKEYADPLALCTSRENAYSGEWFIHLWHAEHLKCSGLAIWQQVFSSLRCTWCYAHRLAVDTWINDTTCLIRQGIDCQITTKTPQQSGRQKTVLILVAAIHFSSMYVRCKIWMSRSQLAQLRCSPLWPWQPRHLPPSSAGEGSAGGGWCWSATSASQEGPLRRNNSKKKKLKGMQDYAAAGGKMKRQITIYYWAVFF